VNPVNHRVIAKIVADYYDTAPDVLVGRETHQPLAEHRHVLFYLCREHTGASYPLIGRWFHRDHTTVVHGYHKIRRAIRRGSPTNICRDVARLSALLAAAPYIDEMELSDPNDTVTA
jgi:chromosomal replication initiation ATPase DnaA